jgi:DNA mismatch endonuclease, patch repair protein
LADVHDKKTRSRNMSAIRAKDTRPELVLRKALHARGYRYRLYSLDLTGKPDLVLARWRAVIFVNGCFWHGHGCPAFVWPKSRAEFWQTKISGNMARDAASITALQSLGWRVAVVWECALKRRSLPQVIDSLAAWMSSDGAYLSVEGYLLERSTSADPRSDGGSWGNAVLREAPRTE